MDKNDRRKIEKLEDLLLIKQKDYVLGRWDECIKNRLPVKIVIQFDSGKVVSIQDQAIIAGSSVLDIYSKRVVDWNTTE